jgi:hypothetical protein
METIFTVGVEDLKRLSAQQAVDFFRELHLSLAHRLQE